ncbi:single-stranded DNA-binding protein [Curtobacterium sp. MCBD17_040]|uniref:single-stranded DNA-binding protein n=1 Tax=Curtobacterium sp. MCBD17_040 TaxID=2175674 RepID=UPI000DAA6060|nr:single-stranded DNA-binding protein [Curtobacterium sp. MCBD17_040]WIB64333.1 single-stranded DNA-binding protein [Curtobacterium sp. MCBD17_040]
MNDTITIRGIVATEPRHLVTGTGLAITSFRLASPSRRWDRANSAWVNGDTNWFTVTAFRSLASNCTGSVVKGDRVLVAGRLRVRTWERQDRSGLAVEIDADAIGHDLAYGRGQWRRTPRQTADEMAAPGDAPSAEERAMAGAVALEVAAGAFGATRGADDAGSVDGNLDGGGPDGDGLASTPGMFVAPEFAGVGPDGVVPDDDAAPAPGPDRHDPSALAVDATA